MNNQNKKHGCGAFFFHGELGSIKPNLEIKASSFESGFINNDKSKYIRTAPRNIDEQSLG